MPPCRMTKKLPAWERWVDAGPWSDLTESDIEMWRNEVHFRLGPPETVHQTLRPLFVWRTLDALGTGLRLLGKAVGA